MRAAKPRWQAVFDEQLGRAARHGLNTRPAQGALSPWGGCLLAAGLEYAKDKIPTRVDMTAMRYEQRSYLSYTRKELREMALRRDGEGSKLVPDEVIETWAAAGERLVHALGDALTSGATCSLRVTPRGELGVTLFHRERRERFVLETPQDIEELCHEVPQVIQKAENEAGKGKARKR